MVILQFNKLIRNKWVWGAFAVLVSLAFVAPDDWFRGDGGDRAAADARNRLAGVEYDASLFDRCEKLVRDFLPVFRRSPAAQCFERDSVKDVWKAYAAAIAAREAGFSTTDELLAERIKAMFSQGDGGFSEKAYAEDVRRAFGIEPQHFEEMLRLWMTIESVLENVAAVSTWPSAMELDMNRRDYTDVFEVRVARFEEDRKKAAEIKLGDKELEKWFGEHKDSLALPERFKLRFVKFDADASNYLAKVSVKEEGIKARYEENAAKGMYDIPPATTNDVKKTKPLEEVRKSIEIALGREASLEWLKNDVKVKMSIDEEDEEAAAGLLGRVASGEGLKVEESDWFAFGGAALHGFGKAPEAQFPGVPRREFERAARSLLDYRFTTFASGRAVWLAELAGRSTAHVPDFAEAKSRIGDRALRDAKLDAFKAEVAAVAAKGTDAVLASKNVSTNIVFSPSAFGRDRASGWSNAYGEWDFKNAGFDNAEKIVFAARSLSKGGISDFVQISPGRAALVVCIGRKAGDPADFPRGERFARMLAMRQQSIATFKSWLDANLERLGYRDPSTSDGAADDSQDDEDDGL